MCFGQREGDVCYNLRNVSRLNKLNVSPLIDKQNDSAIFRLEFNYLLNDESQDEPRSDIRHWEY